MFIEYEALERSKWQKIEINAICFPNTHIVFFNRNIIFRIFQKKFDGKKYNFWAKLKWQNQNLSLKQILICVVIKNIFETTPL